MSGMTWADIAHYNLTWFIIFLIMAFASWPANWLVGFFFRKQMRSSAKKILETENATPNDSAITAKQNELIKHFDLESAALTGKLERIIYIFGVMFGGAFALVSGWLVLKAFYTWLEGLEIETRQQPTPKDVTNETPKDHTNAPTEKANRMVYYHLYLYGNALSLIAGLGLGVIGLLLTVHWPELWAYARSLR